VIRFKDLKQMLQVAQNAQNFIMPLLLVMFSRIKYFILIRFKLKTELQAQ
jgi:hypothetical protein